MIETRTEPQASSPERIEKLPQPTVRTLAAEELLGGERMVLIRHGAEMYRLRQTRNGKLILYK